MRHKWLMWLCLLVFVAGVVVSLIDDAWAARGGGAGDLGIKGEKKVEQVITKERPTKLKIGIGIGSVVVAILVIKYL